MAIEKLNIEQFLELSNHHQVIDVRSPGEYKHAHIPGAYSLPLFTDEERAAVGTAYKQESRQKAIKLGLDFFGPKMKSMVEEAEGLIGNRQRTISNTSGRNLPIANCLLIYCWRGGMRSAGVAWLMDLYGFKVYTLIGGYKKFRNHALETFKLPLRFKILGGYTGSGKTEVLKELKRNGEAVVDLEDIANHKGSAFGNIGLPQQPTQEMFENILALELRKSSMVKGKWSIVNGQSATPLMNSQFARNVSIDHSPLTIDNSPIWLEDESQRIGLVNIPSDLWKSMRQSPVYFLDISFEERLNHIIREYGRLDREKMMGAIERISQRLGGLESKNAISFLLQNDIPACFRILLGYYDRWYLRGLHNREGLNSLLNTVQCDSVNPLNAKKLAQKPEYYENL
jgi:tRNA 2-selenouridine synthase